ncbi:hypothetical protein PENTCL1PPCAC_12153, partial [Pristionchus entomophagus]
SHDKSASDSALLGDGTEPTRQDRSFRVARAVRYDIDGEDVLIAFSTATSDFVLNKLLVQWETKKCKRKWGVVKKCKTEHHSREDPRVFDDVTKNNWMSHVNREMVGQFRTNNANLLV